MLRFAVVFSSLATILAQNAQPKLGAITLQQPLSVCQVLRDLTAFRGQVIQVRGEWNWNLVGDCPELRTKDYIWPSAIFVPLPSNPLRDKKQPVDWQMKFDQSIVDAATRQKWTEWAQLPESQKDRNSVMVTIVGRLDVRDGGLLVDFRGPVGYGPQGVYPAQLVVMEFKDIAVVPVQKRTAVPPHG